MPIDDEQKRKLLERKRELLLRKKAMMQETLAPQIAEPEQPPLRESPTIVPSGEFFNPVGEKIETPEISVRDVGEFGAGMLPGVGSTIGAMTPAPTIGAALGSVAGAFIKTRIQESFPDVFGRPESGTMMNTGNPTFDAAAEDIAFNAAGAGVVGLRNLVTNRKAKIASIVSKIGVPFDHETIKAYEDLTTAGFTPLELTVGSKGGPAKFIEDTLLHDQKKARLKEQHQVILGNLEQATGLKFNSIPTAKSLGQEAVTKSAATLENINKSIISARTKAIKNYPSVQGVTELTDADGNVAQQVVNINNAVQSERTRQVADSLLKEITPFLDQTNFPNALPKPAQEKLKEIVQYAQNLVQTTSVTGIGVDKPIHDFVKLERIYDSLAELSPIKSKGAQQLRKFPKNVKDVNLFISDAANELANAIKYDLKKGQTDLSVNELFNAKELRRTTFPDDLLRALNGEASELYEQALKNPERAKQLVRATKSPRDAEIALLSVFMDKHIKNTPEGPIFDSIKALEEFKGRKFQGLAEIVGGKRRQNINNILQVASNVSPELAMTGKVALGIRSGSAMINVASGAIQTLGALGSGGVGAMAKKGIKTATGGSGTFLSIEFATRELSKMLLDPYYGSIAAGLMKGPVKNHITQRDTLKLLNFMKGAKVLITVKDENAQPIGESLEAEL